jgi:hypothetical protein
VIQKGRKAMKVPLIYLILSASMFGADPGTVLEKTDAPTATTVFYPAKQHEVKVRWRLSFHQLKLLPVVTRSLDGTKTELAMRVAASTTFGDFTLAQVLIVADEKQIYLANHDWVIGTTWKSVSGSYEETFVENGNIVRQIATAKEVYITVMFPGREAPFNRVAFKLSPEQIANCRLMVGKYEELTGAETSGLK